MASNKKVVIIDEVHKLIHNYAKDTRQYAKFRETMVRNCERMRGDLPPKTGNQIEFKATCTICGEFHRFRQTIVQLEDVV